MKIKLLITIIIMLFLTSCTQVVKSPADEVRMNRWSTELGSGSVVTLSFKDDTGELIIDGKGNAPKTSIKGLAVIDNSLIMLYDKAEREPYYFKYKIKNNTLILKYNKDSIVLTRN